MIQVVLGDADELRVGGVLEVSHQLVERVRIEAPHGHPQLFIERPEDVHRCRPVFRRRRFDGGPIFLRRQIGGIAVQPSEHQGVRAGEVQHQFPDAVRARYRMSRGFFGVTPSERLAEAQSVPRSPSKAREAVVPSRSGLCHHAGNIRHENRSARQARVINRRASLCRRACASAAAGSSPSENRDANMARRKRRALPGTGRRSQPLVAQVDAQPREQTLVSPGRAADKFAHGRPPRDRSTR